MTRRLALAAALSLAVGCKRKEVPFNPPPPIDAVVEAALDARVAEGPVDAAAPPPPTAARIVVGAQSSCAILTDGSLRCWGRNDRGQLGDGTSTEATAPAQPALRGVTDLVLGDAHACALLDDSSVTCWGDIGFGRPAPQRVPTAVPGVVGARRVFAVGRAACATLADASLVCWGDVDVQGRLRPAGGQPAARVPTPVAGLERVVALAATGALHDDGTVSSWAPGGAPRPTTLTEVVEIASAGDAVCGLRRDGTVGCAGATARCARAAPRAPARGRRAGRRAPSRKAEVPAPASVETLPLPVARRLAFDAGVCVVTTRGQLQCLEASDGCRADAPWPGLSRLTEVAGSCARSEDGAVRCWQADDRRRRVATVVGISGARQLAASASRACALDGTGGVACWRPAEGPAAGRGRAQTFTAQPVPF